MDKVVGLRDAGHDAGGKAAGLGRLIAAGLPVPDGFVLTHAAFAAVAGGLPGGVAAAEVAAGLAAVAQRVEQAEVPAELAAEVERRAAALGGLLAVRSSVSIEDTAAGAAAGVFSSRVAVPVGEVWAAIRAVWASACTPLVARYASRRGVARLAVGVVVQRHVPGARITVYTRPPGQRAADEAWIERGADGADAAAVKLARGSDDPRVVLARTCEAAIGAADTGADVELIERDDGGGLVVVQARPIVHPAPRAKRLPPPPALLAPLVEDRARGRRWRWDVEHNPAPLSVAQAALVAEVDAAGIAGHRMCTVAGYLYVTDTEVEHLLVTVPGGGAALRDRFAGFEREMASAIAAGDGRGVEAAVSAYVAFYAVWAGKVAPLLAAARAGAKRGSGSVIARMIAATARGEQSKAALVDAIGDMAMAWDVAAPTVSEQVGVIEAAIEAARSRTASASASASASAATLADVALELSEVDDLWFARAQAMVRRALLAHADAQGIARDDVFWLPLGEAIDPIAASRAAAAARAAAARASAWEMPIVPGEANPESGDLWRGQGAGGRVVGRVCKITDGVVPPGTIVVAPTITPALAVLVHGAAALVSDHGGVLAHGAAIARELAIPFVVGCHGASSALVDGDRIEVDGEGGMVRRLEG